MELWHALQRLGGCYGDGASSSELSDDDGKNRGEENGGEQRWRRLYSAAKKHGEATQQPSHASAKPKVATGAPGSQWKLADGEVSPAGTVPNIYRIAICFNSQITPKFVW